MNENMYYQQYVITQSFILIININPHYLPIHLIYPHYKWYISWMTEYHFISVGWQHIHTLSNFPLNKFHSFLLSGHYFKRIESNKRDKINDECVSIIFYDVALEDFSYKNPHYWTSRNIKRQDSDDNCNTNHHWMLGRMSVNSWLWKYWKYYKR